MQGEYQEVRLTEQIRLLLRKSREVLLRQRILQNLWPIARGVDRVGIQANLESRMPFDGLDVLGVVGSPGRASV